MLQNLTQTRAFIRKKDKIARNEKWKKQLWVYKSVSLEHYIKHNSLFSEVCTIICFFRFYPYILLVSCLFMLATIFIYGFHYKQLLNHKTWIMIHHTFTLMIAFVILALNQIINVKEISQGFCKFSGNSHHIANNFPK